MSPLATGEMPTTDDREKILVVDDDELLRGFYAEALCRSGYQVTLAPDGGTALKAFRVAQDRGQPFDLVLMDLRMPGMEGDACARSLLQIDQEARILLISGNRDWELGEDLRDRILGIMSKPVGLGEFLRAVKSGLRGEPVSLRLNDGTTRGKAIS